MFKPLRSLAQVSHVKVSEGCVCQRIAGITAMLQQSLEGLLMEGLQTCNVEMVRHCLRTYATIDKTRDAEALVGQVLVKPYMDQVNITLQEGGG